MASTHSDCGSCGKSTYFEDLCRCGRCGRYVCKTCMSERQTSKIGRYDLEIDTCICDDCAFKQIQLDAMEDQFYKEMTRGTG